MNEFKPKLAIGIGPCTVSAVPAIINIEEIVLKLFPSVPIIYGGPLAISGLEWFFFDYLHATAVIPGDAEFVLADLLTAFQTHKVRYTKGAFFDSKQKFMPNVIRDLDYLPLPARELFNPNYYFPSIRRNLFEFPFATVMCSRGCPYHCGFCAAFTIRNGIQTKRSLENISEEIETLVKNTGTRNIIFYDDSFFSNKSSVNEEVAEFCKAIEAVSGNIVWQLEMRPDSASMLTENTIKTMYRTGCRQINFGIEKGTEKGLRLIGKNLSTDQVLEACRNIKKAAPKLRMTGTFILGGPGETYDEAMETIEFSKKLDLLFAHFYPLEIYPGTKLYQKKFGSDMQVWLEKVLQERVFVGSIIYEDHLNKNDMIKLISKAYRFFYRRKEWKKLAKELLGDYLEDVSSAVFSWGEGTSRW